MPYIENVIGFLMTTAWWLGIAFLVGLIGVGLFILIDILLVKIPTWRDNGRLSGGLRQLSLSFVVTDRMLLLVFAVLFVVTGIFGFLKDGLPELVMLPCGARVDDAFVQLWFSHRTELGCPRGAALNSQEIYFAQQSYEKGQLFFIRGRNGDIGSVIVKHGTANRGETGQGKWRLFHKWSFSENNEFNCDEEDRKVSAIFERFNLVWCREEKAKADLGPLKEDQPGAGAADDQSKEPQLRLQRFEHGEILVDEEGLANDLAYIFLKDGSYVREQY